MNWAKENKFLAGLIGVTVLGAGGLGYLLFTEKSKYDTTVESFETQRAELQRLQTLPAYPDQQNLRKLEEQKAQHLALIQKLQADLASIKIPVEPLTPTGFQDQLKAAVTDFVERAGKASVNLPKPFYMGFDPYQSAPPSAEAAPLLGRELKGIQIVLNQLLQSGVSDLRQFVRDPLPEEGLAKPAAPSNAPEPPKPGPAGAKGKPGASPLVRKSVIDLAVVGEQSAIRDFLNSLSSSKKQYFIPRYVGLHNSNPKGPSQITVDPAAAGVGSGAPVDPLTELTAPVPDPSVPAAGTTKIIVGEERVEGIIRLELVDFAEPNAEAPGKKPAGR